MDGVEVVIIELSGEGLIHLNEKPFKKSLTGRRMTQMRVFNYTENQMVLLNPLAPSETNKQRDTYTHIRRR